MLNSRLNRNSHMARKLFLCITKSNWGGAQKYVFDVATNTPRDWFDTTVLLGGDGILKTKLENANVRTILLKNSQRDISVLKEIKLFFELIEIFKREKPDIIHLNSSKIGLMGSIAGRIVGIKKIVFTAHGWAFNEDRNFISKFFIKLLHNLTIILSHNVISVSENTKQQIDFPYNKKITVIRNGLRDFELKDKESAKKILSEKIIQKNPRAPSIISKKPQWIGTISELHSNKGLTYAIDAVSKIRNIIFIIIGEGERRKELEEQIIKLGLSNKVFLLGHIDSAQILLKAFDIFLLSSITEALPYVLLEAGYASLPTIGTKVGGIDEIIEDEKTGIIVEPKNSEEIKSAIEDLIRNPEKSRLLGNLLKERVSSNFSQKTMLERTFALYRK